MRLGTRRARRDKHVRRNIFTSIISRSFAFDRSIRFKHKDHRIAWSILKSRTAEESIFGEIRPYWSIAYQQTVKSFAKELLSRHVPGGGVIDARERRLRNPEQADRSARGFSHERLQRSRYELIRPSSPATRVRHERRSAMASEVEVIGTVHGIEKRKRKYGSINKLCGENHVADRY